LPPSGVYFLHQRSAATKARHGADWPSEWSAVICVAGQVAIAVWLSERPQGSFEMLSPVQRSSEQVAISGDVPGINENHVTIWRRR
jgi:hypothetical protein